MSTAPSADPSLRTAQLHHYLERMRAGDLLAREDLLRRVCGQLERLARRMLRNFPALQRWVETGDVLQNAVLRLLRALEEVRPGSVRDFFGLAATQMRRELLDLARHFQGPEGLGANHTSHAEHPGGAGLFEPADRAPDEADLERWCAFHEEVARLPAEEREVVGLRFYHDWSVAEVADFLQVSAATVKRRWQTALRRLYQRLGEPEKVR
jgi:RNA polymerase sigma-70 factor (ECF subfamily)